MDWFRKPRRAREQRDWTLRPVLCPDCGAPNPRGALECVECNHPLFSPEAEGVPGAAATAAAAGARAEGGTTAPPPAPARPERVPPSVATWGYRPARPGHSTVPGWFWLAIGLFALAAVVIAALGIATAPDPLVVPNATKAQLASAESLQVVLRADTTAVAPNVALGNLYYDTDNFGEAVPYYRRALRKDPSLIDVRVDLGVAYHNAGDLASARRELEEAVRRAPEHAVARFDLAVVYQTLGLADEARAEYHEARRLPHPPAMGAMIAQLLAQLEATPADTTARDTARLGATAPGGEQHGH